MRPMLKIVILNHINHKPDGSNAPPLIQKWESALTCITEEEEDDEAVDYNTSGIPTLWLPFFQSQ